MNVKSTIILFMTILSFSCQASNALPREASSFEEGLDALRAQDSEEAARVLRNSAVKQPAAGTLLNLGIAEWRCGRAGAAVLAWEQVLWIDPSNAAARNNLELARQVGQIEAPELLWYETVSTWLPANAWAWLGNGSLWLVMIVLVVPHVLRWRKAGWHQGLAAAGLGIFLLAVPAQVGIFTRSNLGFVTAKKAHLLLTPTRDAEPVLTLTGGEPARLVRTHGRYVFVRTPRGAGWMEREQFGPLCPVAK